ncbi:MAG: O-antigen ligase family protein [Phycisphaerae bacterium]|nr:O-antigen ligase family protein [Phycisphaerae bacterium]
MMTQNSWYNEADLDRRDIAGRVLEGLLAAILIFAPLAFGTVDPWSEQVVLAMVGCLSVVFIIRLITNPEASVSWHGVYVPILLFVTIGAVQLLSMPEGLLRVLSPNTFGIKSELLLGLGIDNLDLSTMPLSFYVQATAHDVRLVLAVVTVFMVAVNTYTNIASIKRLLGVICAIGGAVALVGILQFVTQTDKIYWTFDMPHDLANGGPFVNHSHFAQFINLSMGAGIALIMMRLKELTDSYHMDWGSIWDHILSSQGKAVWLPAASVIVCAVSVFVSLSRGGIVSMLAATAFITLVIGVSSTQRGRGQVIAIMVLAAFACVLYIGFDAVYERMATLHDMDAAGAGIRMKIVKDLAAAWSRFPLFGTGLGTHFVVYPMFNTLMHPGLAGHAENEYAQALEETGIFGVLCLAIAAVLVWKAFASCIKHKHSPVHAAAYGLAYGLVAIMIHSFSDFGQHVPANAILTCIFCALLVSIQRMAPDRAGKSRQGPAGRPMFPGILIKGALLILAAGLWIWIGLHANQARIADSHWRRVGDMEAFFEKNNWQGTNEEYRQLLISAGMASDAQPGNVVFKHWLNVYRWRSISRNVDPNTGEILLSEVGVKSVPRIITELKKACEVCPTYGPSYCVMGQLQAFVLGDANGLDYIQTGYRLAPYDAATCYTSGMVDAQQGRHEEAFVKLQRAVQINGTYFSGAAQLCMEQLNDPNKVLTLAGDNIGWLNRSVSLLAAYDVNDQTLVNRALDRVKASLEERSQSPEAPAGVFASLARIYEKDNDPNAAIEYYGKALVKDYSQVYWRFALARLLVDQGELEEAMHEAKMCLQLDSSFVAARRLIQQLVIQISETKDKAPD